MSNQAKREGESVRDEVTESTDDKSTAKHASARASALRVAARTVENPSAIDAECLSLLLSGRPLVRIVDSDIRVLVHEQARVPVEHGGTRRHRSTRKTHWPPPCRTIPY